MQQSCVGRIEYLSAIGTFKALMHKGNAVDNVGRCVEKSCETVQQHSPVKLHIQIIVFNITWKAIIGVELIIPFNSEIVERTTDNTHTRVNLVYIDSSVSALCHSHLAESASTISIDNKKEVPCFKTLTISKKRLVFIIP